MSNFHDSMWATASRDHTAEAHDRAVAMSSVALAGLTPFLHAASSTAEYDQRLALVADRANQLLSAATPDLVAHSAALTQSRSDFETLHMARVAARLESSFRTVIANLRATAGDSVRISQKPECDVCKHLEGHEGVPADYDARLPGLGGKWGNVCTRHFNQYGPGQTGTGHAQKFETEAARPKRDPYAPLAADLYCADCGHGSHAHGNGVCKGCERDGNHDPKHDSVRPNLQPGMSGWETMMSASLDGKTAVSLSNVGIVDKAGLVCKGTDPSGTVVKFKVTDAEMKQLSSVLYSDLAGNFSGVDVDQSDIISEGKTGTLTDSAGNRRVDGPYGKGWARTTAPGRSKVDWDNARYPMSEHDDKDLSDRKTGAKHNDGTGAFVVQVAGVGENVWSQNSLSYDTEDEAKDAASDLLRRWSGADMARVVPTSTPRREDVDPSDPAIVANYRTGSRKQAAATWDDVKPGDKIRIGHEENAKDGIFVRLEKKDDADPIYKGQRFVVYTTTPGGPERKAGLTSFRGQEEAPRPAHTAAKTAADGSSDLDDMISWEEGSLDEDDTVALFQRLIDTGMAWRLQGAYGRQAQALIDAGLCHQPGRGASKTAGGDGSGICGTCKQPISQQDYAWYHHTSEDRAAQKGHEPHPFPHKSSAAAGEKCWDCDGTGKVPSLGGDDPDDVDSGYVDCPTCGGSGHLSKTGARMAVVPPFGRENVRGSLEDLIASMSDEDVLEAAGSLTTESAGAVSPTCPTCKGSGSHPWDAYKKCPKCKGTGRNPKFKFDPDVLAAEGSAKTAKQPSSVGDHGAEPEWETATAHDLCKTCDWPVKKTQQGWVHEDKNPVQWSDKRKASLHTATVKCAKCTAGATPDGADCGYCDGAGSLDATTAMIKAADGWDQGITAQSFLRLATSDDVLDDIQRNDPDGKSQQPTKDDYASFAQWVKNTHGEQAWDDYGNWGKHEAVNSDADGADRYQKTKHAPKVPWADADDWDHGQADQKTLDTGRAGKDRGLPKGMESTGPSGPIRQEHSSSLTKEADIAALSRRLLTLSGQQVSLTYTTDFGVTTANGRMTFADGNAAVTSSSGTVVSVPVHHVMAVESTGWSEVDPAAGEVDRDPGVMDLYLNGWSTATQHQANPYGPGMPDLPPGSSTMTPQTTRPRVAPSSSTYTPEDYPSSNEVPTHRVGPVDRSADTLEVGSNTASVLRAQQAFTAPPAVSPREAKIRQIAASVLSTNPGLESGKARSIAEATVERYAGVTGT